LGAASNFSPVASSGHIVLCDNDGTKFVVQAGRTFRVLSTNPMGERISASPAIRGRWRIYLADSHQYRIGGA
jgi:hypothetical protein